MRRTVNAGDAGGGKAELGYDREGASTAGPRDVSERPRRREGVFRKACLLAVWFVIALAIAWFKFGDSGPRGVALMLAVLSPTFVPVGFILYGSLASTTRRPVPRLPWRRGQTGPISGTTVGREADALPGQRRQ